MLLTLGGGRRVTVDQSTVLGSGGEAVVHRDPDHPRSGAIKVYHDPTPARAKKLEAFLDRGIAFSDRVLAPRELARDSSGQIVGFAMAQLPRRYVRIKELFTPSFCSKNGITTKVVADRFGEIGDTLVGIHSNGMAIGDLNDGAIWLHEEDHTTAWLDVDSWDIPGFPCVVGTELYLSPELYGKDLTKGKKFKPHHDWYSYSVLLFRSLLRKHPFKAGDHPKLKSVLDRAKHGMTVLDAEVAYPKVGLQPDMLTDDLAHALLSRLKLREHGAFPLDLLKRYAELLTGCKSCGLWYPSSRPHCPQCATTTVVDLRALVGVDVLELILTAGRILHCQVAGGVVWVVAEEQRQVVVYRKNGSDPVKRIEIGIGASGDMQFGFFRDTLVIGRDDRDDEVGDLYVIDLDTGAPVPVRMLTTSILAGTRPVYGCSRRHVYRIARNMILCGERFGATDVLERPVTQVFEGQCWFACDPDPRDKEQIFGFNRNLGALHWFVSVGDGKTFETREAAVQQLDPGESLADFSVRFGDGVVLLLRKTRKRGKEWTRLTRVLTATGAIESDETLDPAMQTQWEQIHGRAFKGGTVIHPTDGGVMSEKIATHATATINGTASVVSADDRLSPYGGDILVQRKDRVVLIKKR